MKLDLHNHTNLCNHAEGTVEEYIQRAIELESMNMVFQIMLL